MVEKWPKKFFPEKPNIRGFTVINSYSSHMGIPVLKFIQGFSQGKRLVLIHMFI